MRSKRQIFGKPNPALGVKVGRAMEIQRAKGLN